MICLGVLGLVKGYAAEKQTADECIKSLESRNETLIKETERLRARVREFEDNHNDVVQREQDLVHQQKTLELGVDDSRKGMHCYRCAVLQVCCVDDARKGMRCYRCAVLVILAKVCTVTGVPC